MGAIFYMIGTLMLITGILMTGRGNGFGAVLMVGGVALFLVNLLRVLRQRDDSRDVDR